MSKQYKIAFRNGFIIFDFENEKIYAKSEKGVGGLDPLDLTVDKPLLNIKNWYLAVVDILRNRFFHKAEFRIPQEDFHMELIPYSIEGEAILKIIHESKRQGYIFKVSKRNLFVFKEMFEDIDKLIDIDGVIFEKKGENTLVEGVYLPFQVKKNLKYILSRYVYEDKIEKYFFTFEGGRVEFNGSGFRVFKKDEDEKFKLKAELGIDVKKAINMLMVL